ncbi:MAG: hypothetical protein GWP14_00415 [Actinobacteria bacterium]|nr:hypothetical protein [Actinomycetota bacterium]
MTPRERVYESLKFRETDFIPYNISMEQSVTERLNSYYGGPDRWPSYENHFVHIEWMKWHEDDPDQVFRDPFGVLWQKGKAAHPVEPVLKKPDLKGVHWPELIDDAEITRIEKFCEGNKDRFTCYELGMLFFERAWAMRGFEDLMVDMVQHPVFVDALLETLMQLQLDALDKILHLPFDCLRFGDDFGQQKGLIMGKKYWRRFLKPRLAQIYAKVRESGKILAIHSCGDNEEIMPDLIDIGVQVFNPLQPEAMEIRKMKQLYGGSICFHGGIGVQGVLSRGQPKEVRQQVMDCASVLGKGGGYIMDTAKALMEDVPTENAAALLEAVIEVSPR